MTALTSQAEALQMALDALETLFSPAVVAPPEPAASATSSLPSEMPLPPAATEPPVPPRRAFLRGLAGKR